MAVSKAYLCTEICKMAGHVRKKPEINAMTKKELMIVFTHMTLSKDGDPETKKKIK